MASTPLRDNNDGLSKQLFTQQAETYADDVTEAAGSNRSRNDAVEQEIKVKWQMPGSVDLSTAKKQLHDLLTILLIAFPNQVTLIDGKKREWTYQEQEMEQKFEKELATAAIQLHAMKDKQKKIVKWVAITTVRTTTTIADWKDHDHFFANINAMKIYLFPHPFEADEWEISSIGFIKGVHAVHVPKEELHQQLCQTIMKDHPNEHVPRFQLIPQRITTADKKASTKAFTVQCPKHEAQHLIQRLTHGTFRNSSTQMFVPFRFKSSKPEVYRQCIRQQNEMYHKIWIIKVEGLTDEALRIVEDDIKTIKGVYQVVSSKRTKEIGERKILVEQTKCAFIHRQLTEMWPRLVSKIPSDILDNSPASYSTPMISSKKARDYQDTDSDADSYGSLLTTSTEPSPAEHDDPELDDLPMAYQYPSYAASVLGPDTSTESTQLSSPTASAHNDWQKERQDLEAQVQKQALQIQRQEEQIDRIQTALEEKITKSHELEEKLAQALEVSHSHEVRHQEMMEKFELLMRYQTERASADHQTFESHGRQQKPSESPPSKKANTNASPGRQVYGIFKHPGRQSTVLNTHFKARQTSPSTSVQNMDTDDDPPIPQPVIRPGKKIE